MAKATQLTIYKRYKETSNTKGTTDTKVSVPVLFWNTVQSGLKILNEKLNVDMHDISELPGQD